MALLTLSPTLPHHQALEAAAAAALARRDFTAAFRLADRRCRIAPAPEAHDYLLRAEALHHIGERHAAIRDLEQALAIAPGDIAANRRLLAWATGVRRQRAAAALIADDSDPETLRDAIAAVRRRLPLGSLRVFENSMRGWAVWTSPAPIEVVITDDRDGTASTTVEIDPHHPLSSARIHAAGFELPRPPSAGRQTISLALDGRVFLAVDAPPNVPGSADSEDDIVPADDTTISVIVPVYGDLEATRICLEALLAELDRDPRARAVIVDDATPDPVIAAYLRSIAGRAKVTLLANRRNLGFVGSVNRALRAVTAGDVLLLNADTAPPPGFVARLSEAAHSTPDIGTAVPFSNNAELTSFPIAGQENPLGSLAEVATLDAIAARANDGAIADIPSGTGFCLYVTRACLAAVGGLSETFRRGYFEDVDFTLRARELGFRAVCAASIYVGHAGSRSFGAEKSVLVAKNYPIFAERFPDYAAECAAFAAVDPLSRYRAAIARQAASWPTGAVLMVSGSGVVGEVTTARAASLSANDANILALRIGRDGHSATLGGSSIPPVHFQLHRHDLPELIAALRRIQPAAIELHDPAATPTALLDTLLDLGCPHDFLVADDGLHRRLHDTDPARRTSWTSAVGGARALLAETPQAAAYARRMLPPHTAQKIVAVAGDRALRRPLRRKRRARLGIVTPRLSVAEGGLIRELGLAMAGRTPDTDLVVLGETPIDENLLRLGNVFVSGPVTAGELPRLLREYAVSHIFAAFGRPLFGHPLVEGALADARPVATLDWTNDDEPARGSDLLLQPASQAGAIARDIASWLAEAAA